MKSISSFYKTFIISLITITIVMVTSQTLSARNYYFSTSAGDDTRTSTQAQNPATPWKSIGKLNSFFTSLAAGDSVLFKRGDSFYGSIKVTKSGTSSLPIVIGAYGTGDKPVITGFTTLTSWTSIGNGIYQSETTTCKPYLNIVTVNGKNTPIGRYPNTGFLTIESHSGLTSITDNQLAGTPNWTGAEVVIRKNRYTLSRDQITNHSSGTLTYSGSGEAPRDNFGYFIQNDAKTLDLFGEWYLNPSSKRLQVFFGSAAPASQKIEVSTIDTLVKCSYQSYVNITNLNFEGANAFAVHVKGGQNVSVLSCGIDFVGQSGVFAGSNNFRIESCSINHCNHNSLLSGNPNSIIRKNIIRNSGIIPGMAMENLGNGGAHDGIELFSGDGTLLEYNDIDSVGAHAIFLRGNNVTAKNNLINHYAMILDDVGGIYTVGTYSGRKIIGNIVLNAVGNISGTTSTGGGAKGIFLESNSSHIEVSDNTVAHGAVSGIHLNNAHDNVIRNNVVFNNYYQFLSQSFTSIVSEYTRNLTISKNIFFSKSPSQLSLAFIVYNNDISLFGKADSNYYCRPIDDDYVIKTQVGSTSANTNHTLSSWQTYSGKDPNSKKAPQAVTNENDILFEYNASQSNKVVPLNAVYLGVDGTVYTSSYTLLPYKSVVLIKSANQTINTNLPPFIQNQNFQVNKSTTNGTAVGTVVASDPNVGQLLSYSIVSGNTNGAFAINTSSGLLTVANYSAIAAQTATTYSLTVRVQDNGTGNLNSQATITVSVITSVNQAPVINNQSFSINENVANATTVGTVIATDPDAGQTKTFSIVSGNTNGAFAINASTGVLTVANSATLDFNVAPSFALIIRVQDNGTGLLSSQATITVNLLPFSENCSATGSITYQVWNNIGSSNSVSSLTSNINYPNNPTSSTLITSMEGTTNQANEYGARIAGYICAPATGSYTFWIASDNQGELWLSTNDQPATKQRIAYVAGATLPRAWNSYASQKSVAINLVKGQDYYIEALMKEAYGGDCLAVGWLKPGQTGSVPSEVIPGSVLSPIGSTQTVLVSSVSLPSVSSVNVGSDIMLLATVLPGNATNNTLNWASSNTAVATVNSSGLVTGVSDGNATITATSTDGSNKSDNCLVTVNSSDCSAAGTITYQVWRNIGSSYSISSLTGNSNYPNNPSSSTLLTSMEGPSNQADMYGARIAGYICAPATGSYTFWIASDNNGELWLSTDDQPANMQRIAYVTGATLPRVWNSYATQKSATIYLVQGQRYYIEAPNKEVYGGDCLAVGWLKPGQTGSVPSQVIPGSVLSPIGSVKSQEINISIIEQAEPEVKLSVYPNPLGNNELNIKIDNLSSEATLKIFTITGVECMTEVIQNSNVIQVNRSIFKSGMYIVKVFNENFVKSTKLIVN